jgi:hypothetical protein
MNARSRQGHPLEDRSDAGPLEGTLPLVSMGMKRRLEQVAGLGNAPDA